MLNKMRFRCCLSMILGFYFSTSLGQTDTWTSNGDGTVTDVATGLIWQQTDDNTLLNFSGAQAYCQNLVLAGRSDWRLPNIKELTSIVDFRTRLPAIDQREFPNTNLTPTYWSSTSIAGNTGSGWVVGFDDGATEPSLKTDNLIVRCVRG